jgi:[ribosomal protein S18]-alanine N-acetyltransferase
MESRFSPLYQSSSLPSFQLVPMSLEHAQEICQWKYEPPYDLYNWKPWSELVLQQEEFAVPYIREEQYRSVVTPAGTLIGFAQFFPLEGWIRLGLGIHPEARGRGWGTGFVQAIVEEAKRCYPERQIDLEVLVWNDRARRVYEQAGFQITDRYERKTPSGLAEFYCMEHLGPPSTGDT